MFTFQFLNDKIHNYVKKNKIVKIIIQKIYKLSKTNIFFSHFEGTRGEKTQIFRTQAEKDLNFLGFLIMQNTLKSQTTPVIRELLAADIRTVMVTGDNLLTAISVAR